MNLKYRYQRAKWVYKNEGFSIFFIKGLRFIRFVFRLIRHKVNPFLPPFLRGSSAIFNEEYLYLSNPIFQITAEDIATSKEIQLLPKPDEIKTATWFVPYFEHLAYGGIYTIFRFINGFAERGVHNRIVIYDNKLVNHSRMKAEIVASFPSLDSAELIILNLEKDTIDDVLPESDIAICTFWVSAYLLLKFNKTKRKYYFIQDYEPSFYAGGSTYALAESTYRFGLHGIVNTPGLLKAVNDRHALEGISFVPAIDSKYYFNDDNKTRAANKKVRIFFYARPHNLRNAFELGILIIQQLIKQYGDRIEVVTAGAVWDEAEFGLKGKVTNLGLLKGLEAVGELYRSCDIGFVYMLSKHPSYQPFEFMASGMTTVTNNNEDNLWFLNDGTNCLIAEPSAAAMAEKIGWLIDDPKLRSKIQEGGLKSVSNDWERNIEIIWNDVKKGKL